MTGSLVKGVRTLVGAAVVAALVLLGIAGRERSVALDPVFTFLGAPTMPFVPAGQFVTSSWFCPGVPAGEEGLGGRVVVTNPSDEPLEGRITAFTTTEDAPPVEQRLTISARSSQSIELRELQTTGTFLSAVVEINGGMVKATEISARTRHAYGIPVSVCHTHTAVQPLGLIE